MVEEYYVDLYKEDHVSQPLLNGIDFDRISSVDRLMLETCFLEEEVWKVLSKKKGDKAPRPDGFSRVFFSKVLEYHQK